MRKYPTTFPELERRLNLTRRGIGLNPLSYDELEKIRAWQNGGPPPSMVVNVGRWMDTVDDLRDKCLQLEKMINTLLDKMNLLDRTESD